MKEMQPIQKEISLNQSRFVPAIKDIPNFLILTGGGILGFSALILLLSSIYFIIGIPLNIWVFLAGAFGMLTFLFFFARLLFPLGPVRAAIRSAILIIVIFLSSIVIADKFYDTSFDGEWYHLETSIQLAEGWKPVYEVLPYKAEYSDTSLRVNHFAHASETLAAAVYLLTGELEHGKVFNFLFIFISFIFCLVALRFYPFVGRRWAILIAIVTTLNPIVIFQSMTSCVDGQLASLLTALVAALLILLKRRDAASLIIASLLTLITVSIKFTAVVYVFLFIMFALSIDIAVKRNFSEFKRFFTVLVASFILGTILLGVHPYITNTVRHGFPFYPMAGKNSVGDIVYGAQGWNEDQNRSNRFERFFYANFSRTDNIYDDGLHVRLKLPFTLSLSELRTLNKSDPRLGGFGPLFSGALLLSSITLILALVFRVQGSFFILYVVGGIFLSIFINKECWISRFIPQLYFVPIFISVISFRGSSKFLTRCGKATILVLVVNTLLIASVYYPGQFFNTYKLKSQLTALSQAKQPVDVYFGFFESNRARFKKFGINYRRIPILESLPCKNVVELVGVQTKVCAENLPDRPNAGLLGGLENIKAWILSKYRK